MSDAPRPRTIEVRIDALVLPAGTAVDRAALEAAIAGALGRHAAGERVAPRPAGSKQVTPGPVTSTERKASSVPVTGAPEEAARRPVTRAHEKASGVPVTGALAETVLGAAIAARAWDEMQRRGATEGPA